MTHRYTIGGVAFLVDDELPDLDTATFADATLRVRFVDESALDESDDLGMRRVAGPMDLTGVIDPVAGECGLPTLSADPVDRAWQLRQMAPIFSAVLNRLVLHAGAVEMDGCVVAFVGPSTAGKSTLARFLSDRGHGFVTDDLLPIRFDPAPSTPVERRILPVAAICLLTRSATDTVTAEPLTAIDALQGLVLHGFGEHGDAPSWAFQFDAYHRIAELIPTFNLTIPDDLTALPTVEHALIALASQLPAPGRAAS